MKDISNLIQPSIDKSEIMGAAVAILQDGQIVYTGGFGQTTIAGHGIPITDKTLFVYGSIAKNVCAALIMRLVE
ncbi:MAG: serine hydrolase domain-containing protein, partial [Chloroflexota bacterium]